MSRSISFVAKFSRNARSFLEFRHPSHKTGLSTSYFAHLLASALALLLVVSCSTESNWRGVRKIGMVVPFSGYDSQTAYIMLAKARSILDDLNVRGGIGGYRLELVALDDGHDSGVALQRAKEITVDPDVMLVLVRGNGATAQDLRWYEQHGTPVIVIGGPVRADANAWLMCADAGAEGQTVARNAASARNPIVVSMGEAGYAAASTAFANTMGGKVVTFSLEHLPGFGQGGDPSEGIIRVAETNADFIYFSGPYDAGANFAQLMSHRSRVNIVLGSDADSPALSQLTEAMPERERPGYVTTCRLQDYRAQGLTATAEDGMRIAVQAMRKTIARGVFTRDRVGETMSLTDLYDGVNGPVSFDNDRIRRDAKAEVQVR